MLYYYKHLLLICLVISFNVQTFVAQTFFAGDLQKESIKKVCNAVADWQILNHGISKHHKLDWTNGVLYIGMVEWGKISQEGKYCDFVSNVGEEYSWNMYKRTFHADDICVGQAFIELYKIRGMENIIRPVRERAFYVASHPSKAPLLKSNKRGARERWSWCDALFMAPPVYAALYGLTGEQVYATYMDSEFKECTDSLYDSQYNLYYRDCMRISLRENNGEKQFWSRGNGWVFAGIPLIINHLPKDYPNRGYYIEIFKNMAKSLIKLQNDKGYWHASLLCPETYPQPETSGSAFFCYGLAWGINNGLLKGDKYKQALRNGWLSLVSSVHEDGKLGYVQPIGASPNLTSYDNTDVYGVGAFLLAGSELLKMDIE